MTRRIPVSEEDKQKSYYKYYLREMTRVPQSVYDSVGESHAFSRDKCMSVYDRGHILDDGYFDMEQGHGVDSDCSPMLANLTFFPNCTPEMLEWWFLWHSLDHLRYRIWDPEDHYFALNQSLDRALDKRLSIRERTWDVTHIVDENIFSGNPYEREPLPLPDFTRYDLSETAAAWSVPCVSERSDFISLDFKRPKDFGIDENRLYNGIGGALISANGRASVPGVPGVHTVMMHFARPVKGGCELRSRFWGGYQIINGEVIKTAPSDEEATSFIAMQLLYHNIKEFNHLASFLPEIYAEEKGAIS